MYDDALTWCREELLFDPVPYDSQTNRLAQACCKALDGYDDDYQTPDAFFHAAQTAIEETHATTV